MHAALQISGKNDPLEREADRVAEQVVSGWGPPPTIAAGFRQVSRRCGFCKEEDGMTVMSKPAATRSASSGFAPLSVHEVISAPGTPLDAAARAFFEPRLGRNLSDIRLHTDARADESAQAVGALAYAVGKNIVFARDQYRPNSAPGRRLLAHELVHTIQQEGLGNSRLQRFMSTEPAGGCGLCYGLPRNAGNAAHRLIQTEFEIMYPMSLAEFGILDPDDQQGRLDLMIPVPDGFEIGEIKPANERGYADGIARIAKYMTLLSARYPASAIRPLTKMVPSIIFPDRVPGSGVTEQGRDDPGRR